ncbi:N-acetylglucosaminyldiphosphodolichol N-acetylglucosaminyltransferase catalytic subunit alg13 [Recurvomyces mirabilis]|nr:N-acetylglucosaminyldiphosphodolichol N-acetylglucosaminyltransferase catalytic subunit alg13 [Recurvomyces mirabilis]
MASSKTCFVTIGATASFAALVKAVLSTRFLTALKEQRYDELLVQYGQDGKEMFETAVKGVQSVGGIKIHGFGIDENGLGRYMRQARGKEGQEGVVIAHAGSGTILEALRIQVPLIIVPNSDLLDNHQVELAEALSEQEYVVHGHLENLPKALQDAEQLRTRQKQWPPPNSGVHRQSKSQGLKGVLDEEMGFLD